MTERYRPSNGAEGMDFMEKWCDRCKRDEAYQNGTGDSCPIAARAVAYFEIEHPNYPVEWCYADNGEPQCTAFEEIMP